MKHGTAKIGIILDRSRSMIDIVEGTEKGLKEFYNEQKSLPNSSGTSVLLTQFDTVYEKVFDLPLHQVPEPKLVPRGMTALYDAIGRTINELGESLSKTPEHERPEHVIVVIVTDGEENSSKEFTCSQVADMIKHQQENYFWNFVFLGANQDAILTAKKLNIGQGSTLTYNSSNVGTMNAFRSASMYTNATTRGVRHAFDSTDRASALKDDEN